MRTYRSLSQEELKLSDTEWADLTDFVADAQQQIAATDGTDQIESPPPTITKHNGASTPVFDPGGWVGAYPGDIHVYPGKINHLEYEYLLQEVAGWFELWDIPTAAAVLPMVNAGMVDSRSVIVGYSTALITFTEEALAHRPPTNISRETDTGFRIKGSLNLQRTITAQARGSQKIAYDQLQFSLTHPINLLLLRFHVELAKELDTLIEQSYVMTATLEEHRHYHRQFLEREFTDKLLDKALDRDFTDPTILSDTRREAPQGLAELVELWESYLRDQTLSIDFAQQLNVGVKPIEKVYELWILNILLEILTELLETDSRSVDETNHVFDLGERVTLFYNKSLYEHSQIIAEGFNTNPGRPDYALAVDGDIVWVGDAKFRHASGIGLESYQRFLAYAVDLMSLTDEPVGSLIHIGTDDATPTTVTDEVTIEQLPLRPKHNTTQRTPLRERLEACLQDLLDQ